MVISLVYYPPPPTLTIRKHTGLPALEDSVQLLSKQLVVRVTEDVLSPPVVQQVLQTNKSPSPKIENHKLQSELMIFMLESPSFGTQEDGCSSLLKSSELVVCSCSYIFFLFFSAALNFSKSLLISRGKIHMNCGSGFRGRFNPGPHQTPPLPISGLRLLGTAQ